MAKLKGLGRGLDALLGGEESPTGPAHAPTTLATDALEPGRFQPRTRIDQTKLAELAESVKSQGIVQPILVRPSGAGRYEIIAGERRWRAARLAGLASVPVLIREVADRQALALALIENIQREDLNPMEEAVGLKRLLDEFGMTHGDAATVLGRSRAAVTNALRLLDLAPPVQELLREGRLDMGHARALLPLAAIAQVELARDVVARQLSVREVERKVTALLQGPAEHGRPRVDRDVARLEEEVSQRLGTTVSIRPRGKKGGGRLVVQYASLEHLDALLAKLR